MTYNKLPSSTPQLLRNHGLTVVEVDGWENRGRPSSTGNLNPVGVLCHHTATGKNTSVDATLQLLRIGRSDLPGPLCHFSLGRDGTVYVVAAGRANHAGVAKSSGTVAAGDGNALYWGIEAMNDGVGEKWPDVQYDAYVLLCAVLSKFVTKNSVNTVRGHKETSVTGKIDPTFNMDNFRKAVKAKMDTLDQPTPAPVKKPSTDSPYHTRWATQETAVLDAPGGKVLHTIPKGFQFSVVTGSGSSKNVWIETKSKHWVDGTHTTKTKPDHVVTELPKPDPKPAPKPVTDAKSFDFIAHLVPGNKRETHAAVVADMKLALKKSKGDSAIVFNTERESDATRSGVSDGLGAGFTRVLDNENTIAYGSNWHARFKPTALLLAKEDPSKEGVSPRRYLNRVALENEKLPGAKFKVKGTHLLSEANCEHIHVKDRAWRERMYPVQLADVLDDLEDDYAADVAQVVVGDFNTGIHFTGKDLFAKLKVRFGDDVTHVHNGGLDHIFIISSPSVKLEEVGKELVTDNRSDHNMVSATIRATLR